MKQIHHKYNKLFLCLLGLIAFSCEKKSRIPAPGASTGVVSVLDAGGEQEKTGWWPRMAFDQKGLLHLAYCDVTKGDLRYGLRNAQGWQLETAISKGAVGKYIGIAVDNTNKPVIIFYDQDKKILRYAYKDADQVWQSERIAWGLEIGMGGEIIVDKDNIVHAFYYITSGQLIHAKRIGPKEWQKKALADAVGSFTVRISVREYRDALWITYMDWDLRNSRLHLGKLDGDHFESEKITGRLNPGWRSYLFFTDNEPQIIFTQGVKSQIRWAQKGPDGWSSKLLIDNVGNLSAHYEQKQNVLYIAYEDYGVGFKGSNLRLLEYSNKIWKHTLIDQEGPAGTYLDLAVYQNRDLVMAYYVEPIRGLRIYEESSQVTHNGKKQ